nr:uncharacterized protein LOC129524927 [Gorilla gorilla gorilla]
MEKSGRRWLASAAPPLGRLRRRESGAEQGGLGVRATRVSLVRSALDCAPRSGVRRPGSYFCRCRRRIPVARRARLPQACSQHRTEPSGGRGWSARPAWERQGRR